MGGDGGRGYLARRSVGCALSAFLIAIAASCSDVVRRDTDDASATGTDAATTASMGAGGLGGVGATGAAGSSGDGGGGGSEAACTPRNTQCTDCIDNDADGSVDAWDYECTSVFDDDEGSFNHGIPDRLRGCAWDCFFDGNGGSGDDHCSWNAQCDPLSPYAPKCPYDAAVTCPAIKDECLSSCLPKTPNGCDCFGCCDWQLADGTTVQFLLASPGCTDDSTGDPAICHPCTRTEACWNPCEPCEYCVGKHELSPECGGVAAACPDGAPACTPDLACPPAMYCLTGCCIELPW